MSADNDNKPKRTAVMILGEIEQLLSSIDGISTADAFKLGSLVREYGGVSGSEAVQPLMLGLVDALAPKPKKNPWETP